MSECLYCTGLASFVCNIFALTSEGPWNVGVFVYSVKVVNATLHRWSISYTKYADQNISRTANCQSGPYVIDLFHAAAMLNKSIDFYPEHRTQDVSERVSERRPAPNGTPHPIGLQIQ